MRSVRPAPCVDAIPLERCDGRILGGPKPRARIGEQVELRYERLIDSDTFRIGTERSSHLYRAVNVVRVSE